MEISQITFLNILSSSSGYSIVWKGFYKGKSCAIKMSVLNTGTHYDKDNDVFIGNDKVFEHDECKPFYHTMFKNKRAISKRKFEREIKNQQMLVSFAPKVYTVSIIVLSSWN